MQAWQELEHGSVCLTGEGRNQLLREGPPAVLITDCKGLYDAVNNSETSALGLKDKRAAVECLAIREALQTSGVVLRWVHSQAQLADALTKIAVGPLRLLNHFLSQCTWKLVHDPNFESARKRAVAGKGILDVSEANQNLKDTPGPSFDSEPDLR